mgnify:CR=1 FL=1
MGSFLASNQMAVTQLAIKYCDQLVESNSLRPVFFSDFDFTQAASSAFADQDRKLIFNPLLKRILGQNLNDQPESTAVETELNALLDRLSDCPQGKVCDANYTKTVVKALCAATLGSAAVTLQ